LGFVIAIFDISTGVVFLDPSINMLDIEGDHFTEPRNLFL